MNTKKPDSQITNNVYKPVFYRLNSDAEKAAFHNMTNTTFGEKHDTIHMQLVELLACRNPSMSKKEILDAGLVETHLGERDKTLDTYGVWVYYPWKNQVVHILDEDEFIEVRTNRNKYKITDEEQEILRSKKIGIAGLSVGRAVATTLVLERVCGEIRLADFDELELSNLNRIQARLSEMGMNKTVSAA